MVARDFRRPAGRVRRSSTVFRAGLVFIFLLALVLRLTYPLSRSVNWYNRSIAFWDALLAGNWAGTYRQYHPGVVTMWVAGLGLRVYMLARGWSSGDMYEAETVASGLPGQPHRAGVAALALVIAACIALMYVLLARLTTRPVAFVSGWFLALDPFHILQSKVLHVDALLASFMLVSALFLLGYLRGEKRAALVLSGVFAGLAFLSKSSSAVLVPYAVLVVAWPHLRARWKGRHEPSQPRAWFKGFSVVVRDLGLWGLAAVCVFVVLWPAMWVAPVKMVSVIVERALFHVETPHWNPGFFAGRVVDGDPGPLFYPATIAWKTTLVTLPALAFAVVRLIRRTEERRGDWAVRWVLAYACAFVVLMSLAARKEQRYLAPVFLALDVLAARGLVEAAAAIGRCSRLQKPAVASAAFLCAGLVVHAGAVLRHTPHYGTHYNLLLGGSRVAQHVLPLGDQGEGLELAARFLNHQAKADEMTVAVHRGSLVFRRNFEGATAPIDAPNVDYWVFQINAVQRELAIDRWGDIWDALQRTEPLWSVTFDGVPYVWVYRAYPHTLDSFDIEHQLDVRLGDHIELVGYRLDSDEVSSGDTLAVTLYWQSDGRLTGDNHVFVHLLGSDGSLAAQHDGVPYEGTRATWTWRDAEIVPDEHTLPTSALPTGTYRLSVGMYDYSTKDRLPAVSADSGRLTDDSVPLAEIRLLP